MLRIAVVSRYFPSSAEPWQGRSAYETLRVLPADADIHVFYPNPIFPAFLRPRSRLFVGLDKSYSPGQVNVSYFDYPALPLISRPFNGAMAASTLLPHVRAFRPDLIFSPFLYPVSYAGLQIAKKLGVPLVAMGIGSDIHSIADRISAMYTRTGSTRSGLSCHGQRRSSSESHRDGRVARPIPRHPERLRSLRLSRS